METTEKITKLGKLKVKLFTLWTTRYEKLQNKDKPHETFISHGVWEAEGVNETDRGRVYTLRCKISSHKDLKIGDTREMSETMIIAMCHPVSFTVYPKIGEHFEKINKSRKDDPVINDEVVLKFDKEDLESIDLGASGIVLESWLKQFGSWPGVTFRYAGTMKENEDWCFIESKTGLTHKVFLVRKDCIQKKNGF